MIKKLLILILGSGILYLTTYRLWHGYFPPETPYKLIGVYLNKPIPDNWNVVFFNSLKETLGTPYLMAIMDVPSQDIPLAKRLLEDPKHFNSIDDLRQDACFIKSEFSRNILLSDSLGDNAIGFFYCYLEEKLMKSEGDSVITRVITSNTVVLDVKNKRLMLGMF